MVPPVETTPTSAAETDIASPPSNAVPPVETTPMSAAETDIASPPSNAVPPVEEADIHFTPPVSFISVYFIVQGQLIPLITIICMHWCQYLVRDFSEIKEALSFAQENFIVLNVYF